MLEILLLGGAGGFRRGGGERPHPWRFFRRRRPGQRGCDFPPLPSPAQGRRQMMQFWTARLFRSPDFAGGHNRFVQAFVTRHDSAHAQLSDGYRRYGRAAVTLLEGKVSRMISNEVSDG